MASLRPLTNPALSGPTKDNRLELIAFENVLGAKCKRHVRTVYDHQVRKHTISWDNAISAFRETCEEIQNGRLTLETSKKLLAEKLGW